MKKRVISAALTMLLLMLLFPACAFADVYSDPAPVEAGSALDHLAAVLESGSSLGVSAGALPEGVALSLEEQESGLHVYLRGTPMTAGEYNCVLSSNSGDSFIVTVQVLPARPTVSVGGDLSCYPGDELSLTAEARTVDGGYLSYQWYAGLTGDFGSATAIGGATEAFYQPSTAYVGSSYYTCMVTNTNNGYTVSTVSDPVKVTVEELNVSALSVETLPGKTQYRAGDTLDTTGLQIRAELANGGSRIMSDGFTLYPTRLEKAGEQRIEVSYQGKICTFTVTVEPADEVIEGIGVLTMPTRTEYFVGETLDPRGLSIRVYTNNGQRDVSEGLECEPMLLEQAGFQTITVHYGEKTCTFTVDVTAEVKPVSLGVYLLPDKTHYTVGESLDTTGLVLRQTDSRGQTQEIRSGFTCEPVRLDSAGRQEITVRYGEQSCRFTVTVEEKAAAASPTPSPSPSAAPQPTPEPTPAPAPRGEDPGSMGRTLAVVVVGAAALALAVLGVYVYVMNRGGFAEVFHRLKERIGKKNGQ